MKRFLVVLCLSTGLAISQESARAVFEGRCGVCHGADGNGGEFAASIVTRIASLTDADLTTVIRSGMPGRGMPPVAVADGEMPGLLS